MSNNGELTVKAVKEALDFIESTWNEWEGDFHEFMANVISEESVTQYEVKELLDSISKGEEIEGIELDVQKRGSSYKIKVL
jgi:hypothetical protein